MHVVILGGYSGIGAALAAHYLQEQAQVSVFSRDQRQNPPADALNAHDLTQHTGLRHYHYQSAWLDQPPPAFAATLQTVFHQPVDIVICCLGILHQNQLQPEKSTRQLQGPALRQVLEVNTVLPALWLQLIWPLLPHSPTAKLCWLSAKVGSITDNQSGGWHSYRASKAALNMLVRCAALELRRTLPQAVLVALHPGTTDTPLSQPFQRNLPPGQLQTPADTAQRLSQTIASLTPRQHGCLLHWDGTVLPY